MAALLSSIFCCCGAREDPDELDERTALLNPDIIPTAPARPVGRTTEEQLAEQEALRRILHEASERFVNIESPSPFTRPSHSEADQSPYSSRSPSPTASSFDSASSIPIDSPRTRLSKRSAAAAARARKSSTSQVSERGSTWRAPNDDAPVRVVHLGTNFEPHERDTAGGSKGSRDRPMSSHSLRTLPRGGGGGAGRGQPSPLGKNGGRHDGDEDEEEDEEEDSRFATMASYRTAHEGQGSEEGHGLTVGRSKNGVAGPKQALGDMWKQDGDGDSEGHRSDQGSEELNRALAQLEADMTTFQLTSVGPIVADLSDAA